MSKDHERQAKAALHANIAALEARREEERAAKERVGAIQQALAAGTRETQTPGIQTVPLPQSLETQAAMFHRV